jgi:hypothetical protein
MTAPSGADQELLKVPLDVAGLAGRVGHGGQLGIERVPARAVDLDLLEHREADPVVDRAELTDLFRGAGLLPAELVAGEANDREPPIAEPVVQPLQARVLRGQAALRGDVHHEQGGPGQVAQ